MLAKYERAKIAERTRRGKLRKAREGKVVPGCKPNYGFAFNENRDGYVVVEDEMLTVRRIFRMIGVERMGLAGVKKTLDREGVLTPGGARYSSRTLLRRIVLADVYKPHTFDEIKEIVSPEIAPRLDSEKCYSVWWFSRRFVDEQRVKENGAYRRKTKTKLRPRENWIGVPVPDAGVPREWIDAARDAIKDNRVSSSAGRRFWELSAGLLRCAFCDNAMGANTTCTGRNDDKRHFYYQCRTRYNNAGRDCANRKSLRAEETEERVWEFVCNLLTDPKRLRAGLTRVIEEERTALRGDPDKEAKTWAAKIEQTDLKRSGFQDMAAEGLITLDELRSKLAALGRIRKTAEKELEALNMRRQKIEILEEDAHTLLASYTGLLPEALNNLDSQERHNIYKMLRLTVKAYPDKSLEASGALV